MKINWGHKLVFFMITFMMFIVVLIYNISKQQIDLVDKNYYEKGIRYQDEINKFSASDSIRHEIGFDLGKRELSFTTNIPNLEGNLYFYKASDAGLDFDVPFKQDEKGFFAYNTSALKKGIWKVTFEWTLNGRLMAAEKQIMIK